jgi:hypothetical protein
MRWMASAGMFVSLLCASSCIHVKGVVLEERTEHPLRTAVVSVGRPNGIAVLDSHPVNSSGSFDFYILPTDDGELYVYDGAASPELTMEHIDQSQVSTKMKLRLNPAPKKGTSDIDMRIPGQP